MIVAYFHIAGIVAVDIKKLKILQNKFVPEGLRCFRWRMVMSGLVAVELLHFPIALPTE